jgi:hypothetical protein
MRFNSVNENLDKHVDSFDNYDISTIKEQVYTYPSKNKTVFDNDTKASTTDLKQSEVNNGKDKNISRNFSTDKLSLQPVDNTKNKTVTSSSYPITDRNKMNTDKPYKKNEKVSNYNDFDDDDFNDPELEEVFIDEKINEKSKNFDDDDKGNHKVNGEKKLEAEFRKNSFDSHDSDKADGRTGTAGKWDDWAGGKEGGNAYSEKERVMIELQNKMKNKKLGVPAVPRKNSLHSLGSGLGSSSGESLDIKYGYVDPKDSEVSVGRERNGDGDGSEGERDGEGEGDFEEEEEDEMIEENELRYVYVYILTYVYTNTCICVYVHV